mgnify:FL=1
MNLDRVPPLSSPHDQLQARNAGRMGLSSRDPQAVRLAEYLLRALAQIEALTLLADPMAQRFQQGNHRYPDLVNAGLGHLWVGPSFNDFAPGLIEACRKHLKTHNLPAQRGHACDYIRNRIKEGDFGALEQRWSEGLPRAAGETPTTHPQVLDESAVPPPGTKAYADFMEQRRRALGR